MEESAHKTTQALALGNRRPAPTLRQLSRNICWGLHVSSVQASSRSPSIWRQYRYRQDCFDICSGQSICCCWKCLLSEASEHWPTRKRRCRVSWHEYLRIYLTGCRHIKRYAGKHKDRIQTECLYQYKEPVSPHLAARLASAEDESLVRYLSFIYPCYRTQRLADSYGHDDCQFHSSSHPPVRVQDGSPIVYVRRNSRR